MGLLLPRIVTDGAILTALLSAALVGILYFKPRLALSDYPADVRAAVPARTKRELRQGILIAIPLMLVAVAVPCHSLVVIRAQHGGVLTYWMAILTIFGEYFLFSIFDLIVLDIWMFFTWTPAFLVLPGTEGMAGYKNWRPHAKAQLVTGTALLAVISAVLALIATLVL